MSILSELIRDAERAVKDLVRGNPQLKMLVKGAQIVVGAYDQMFPGSVAKAQQEVLKAEQKLEQGVAGFLTGSDRRTQVLNTLLTLRGYKKMTQHDWLTIIQNLVAMTPRKLEEAKK